MFKRQNTTVILQDLFSSKFHLEVSCMKQEPWKPIAKIKTIFTSYYNNNATFSKTESNMLAREVVFQHNVKKLHVCTRTLQNCFCNMHNNNCKFLQLTFFFKKVFILSRSLYVSCGRTICQAARGGRFLQLWGPHVILALLLLLLAGVAQGQQAPVPPPALAPAPQLRDIEEQLTDLTKHVASIISDRFGFCIADP